MDIPVSNFAAFALHKNSIIYLIFVNKPAAQTNQTSFLSSNALDVVRASVLFRYPFNTKSLAVFLSKLSYSLMIMIVTSAI